MDVKLVIEKNKKRVQVLKLRAEETIIGRRKDCDLRIPSSEVSRRHCLLSAQRGYLTVEDLDSANGTYLNGRAVNGKQVVRPGDRLRIGPVTFVVEYQLTSAALDQMLGGDREVAEAVVEPIEEVSGEMVVELVDEEAPLKVEDELPTAVAAAEAEALAPAEEELPVADVAFEGAAGWAMPSEGDELRDLLSGLNDPQTPNAHKNEE